MTTTDSHIHTEFSSDSQEKMERMVCRGIELGLDNMIFTDHMDIDFPPKYEYDFLFDVSKQQAEIESLQKKYHGKITLLKGIELGLQVHLPSKINTLLKNNFFDYVIGSIHIVDEMDPYCHEYWETFSSEEKGILKYFETGLSCLEKINTFDSFGHLDYVIRYAPTGASNYSYKKYAEIIDAILRKLVSSGKALEVNTSGFRKNGFANPHIDVVKRFIELGGEMITIGSDAHEADYLAADFDRICAELKKAGLRYYTVFCNRKPVMKPL